jgi:hypothetical protein
MQILKDLADNQESIFPDIDHICVESYRRSPTTILSCHA